MQMLIAALEAALVTAGYCAAVYRCNDRYELGLGRERLRFSLRIFALVGVLTLFATGLVSLIRLSGLSVSLHALTLFLIWGMAVLTVTDSIRHRIPNRLLLALLFVWAVIISLSVILDPAAGMALLPQSLAGGMVGGLIFLLCYILSGKQMGAGDVKLVFVMGLYLTGQRILGAVFYGSLLCCAWSLLQLARKKLGLKDGVPLVPFLYLGTLITLFIL
jgi:prepilin signal peptidase PulO-like enzyme (type II secretory pathway)